MLSEERYGGVCSFDKNLAKTKKASTDLMVIWRMEGKGMRQIPKSIVP